MDISIYTKVRKIMFFLVDTQVILLNICSAKILRKKQNQDAYQILRSQRTASEIGLPPSLQSQAVSEVHSSPAFQSAYTTPDHLPILILGLWQSPYSPITSEDTQPTQTSNASIAQMIEDTQGHQLCMLQKAGEARFRRSSSQRANRDLMEEIRKEMEARLVKWESASESLEATDGLSDREKAMYRTTMEWGATILYSLRDEALVRARGLRIYHQVYQNKILHWQDINIV